MFKTILKPTCVPGKANLLNTFTLAVNSWCVSFPKTCSPSRSLDIISLHIIFNLSKTVLNMPFLFSKVGNPGSFPWNDHLFEAHVQRLGVYFGLKLLKGWTGIGSKKMVGWEKSGMIFMNWMWISNFGHVGSFSAYNWIYIHLCCMDFNYVGMIMLYDYVVWFCR